MSSADQHEPLAAVTGTPAALSVTCPYCEEATRHFEFDELKEDPCGSWWSVADEYRFDHCELCGGFVDCGTVGCQLHPHK